MVTASTTTKTRRRAAAARGLDVNPDVLLQLYELLQGERGKVTVYSKALGSPIHFVNPAVVDPESLEDTLPVYTTRELAFVLSLSDEELRRYHYFKQQLID